MALSQAYAQFSNRFVADSNGCWNWIYPRKGSGYGTFWVKGKSHYAHKFIHELMSGKTLHGHSMEIDHACSNTSCVNPFHLQCVSNKENHETQRSFNAEKVECKWGHSFDEENTYWYCGRRMCKICREERRSERRAVQRYLGLKVT